VTNYNIDSFKYYICIRNICTIVDSDIESGIRFSVIIVWCNYRNQWQILFEVDLWIYI